MLQRVFGRTPNPFSCGIFTLLCSIKNEMHDVPKVRKKVSRRTKGEIEKNH